MPTNYDDEPDEIGKPHPTSDSVKPKPERARDVDDDDGEPGDASPQKSDASGAEHSVQRAGGDRGEKPQKPNTRPK